MSDGLKEMFSPQRRKGRKEKILYYCSLRTLRRCGEQAVNQYEEVMYE